MKVEKVDPNRSSFSDFRLDRTILIIGNITINLTAEQEDQEKVIVISDHEGMLKRGMRNCCRYVAEVIIPPRRYEEVEIDAPKGKDMQDEAQELQTENIPVPLDLDSVVLKVWPLEVQIEKQEGENNVE